MAAIKESVAGVTYDQFLANREKRQSVAYNIEIIGEAANALAGGAVADPFGMRAENFGIMAGKGVIG